MTKYIHGIILLDCPIDKQLAKFIHFDVCSSLLWILSLTENLCGLGCQGDASENLCGLGC